MNWSSPNKVIIQGITELEAAFYAVQMKTYGTEVIAGVSPGRGGTKVEDIPVFDLVEQVLTITDKIDTSLIFVPPYQVLDAVKEAIATGIRRVIILTSNIAPLDTIEIIKHAQAHNTLILGPGSDGITLPDQVWLGRLQPHFYQPGNIGSISTSRDLSYEVAAELNQAGMGQSIVVGLGNDHIIGSNLLQWLSILEEDPQTDAIIFIGERIKQTEEILAHCRDAGCHKPIIAYVAGLKTPQERIFRDAVTIISNHLSASIPVASQERRIINKLKKVGVRVAKRPSEIPSLLSEMLHSNKI
ncbi:CoA-binding protein [Waterburya agarophytonicola K14]|uniref:CoA-binding protein n=2 Tax=Waterburya TaxID=2886915 RepID=A0A964BP74_9CYAN|nr:CoA-binding protein [Waterburya agarophytonicola KI4]